jgi:hypothetical protein
MPGVTDDGILVVVTGAPADLRPVIENVLTEHYLENPPMLHLMDPEGVRALSAFMPVLATAGTPEDVAYHAVSLPSAPVSDSALIESRRKRAREGLVFAEKRIALAELLLKGGFPEEMTRPLREALGWGLTSLLALHTDRDPAADLPSPRLVQAELVERGHLPPDLSQRLAQTRDLTAPPDHGEDSPPLSTQIGQTLLDSVHELVSLVQEQTVKAGI